jgi:hypothetical protein
LLAVSCNHRCSREHLTFAAKLEIGVRSQESGARRKEEEGRRKEPEEVFLQISDAPDVANPKISPNETAPKVTDFLLFTFYNFKRFLISTSKRINFFRHNTPPSLSGNFLIYPYLHNTL